MANDNGLLSNIFKDYCYYSKSISHRYLKISANLDCSVLCTGISELFVHSNLNPLLSFARTLLYFSDTEYNMWKIRTLIYCESKNFSKYKIKNIEFIEVSFFIRHTSLCHFFVFFNFARKILSKGTTKTYVHPYFFKKLPYSHNCCTRLIFGDGGYLPCRWVGILVQLFVTGSVPQVRYSCEHRTRTLVERTTIGVLDKYTSRGDIFEELLINRYNLTDNA
ncbi:hypothetical protein AGLY_014975 [Aphis glycines]|uniref:Uncharacterized protein n=1 Tax=Aphis glycines TaxID=307491 RepID=A0A6G0T3L3_APHGL|nr:hypothetical protein AGLY_014975 [Aphis glycines]